MKPVSRALLDSWEKINLPSFANDSMRVKSNLRSNWALKAKQLSKIIAYSWLDDKEGVEDIRQAFLYPKGKKDHPHDLLRELLTSDATNSKWPFLKVLFLGEERFLPIFDKDEISLYEFDVSWDTFTSSIEDINDNLGVQNDGPVFKVVLPYPPRPPLDGSTFGLKKEDIERWVKTPLVTKSDDGTENIRPVYPETPYIPTTCC